MSLWAHPRVFTRVRLGVGLGMSAVNNEKIVGESMDPCWIPVRVLFTWCE